MEERTKQVGTTKLEYLIDEVNSPSMTGSESTGLFVYGGKRKGQVNGVAALASWVTVPLAFSPSGFNHLLFKWS